MATSFINYKASFSVGTSPKQKHIFLHKLFCVLFSKMARNLLGLSLYQTHGLTSEAYGLVSFTHRQATRYETSILSMFCLSIIVFHINVYSTKIR